MALLLDLYPSKLLVFLEILLTFNFIMSFGHIWWGSGVTPGFALKITFSGAWGDYIVYYMGYRGWNQVGMCKASAFPVFYLFSVFLP